MTVPTPISTHTFTLTNNFVVYAILDLVGDVKCGVIDFTQKNKYYEIASCAENIIISKNDIEVYNEEFTGPFMEITLINTVFEVILSDLVEVTVE